MTAFQIVLGCVGVAVGLYGLREASMPLGTSIFSNTMQAEVYALVSVTAVVIGAALAFLSVMGLIYGNLAIGP